MFAIVVIIAIVCVIKIYLDKQSEQKYKELEADVLKEVGFSNWCVVSYYDNVVIVKSRQALENYDKIKYFKENKERLEEAERIINRKAEVTKILKKFLECNKYESHEQYSRVKEQVHAVLLMSEDYRIKVNYVTSAGNCLASKGIIIDREDVYLFKADPALLMGKGEYNKYIREKQRDALNQKHLEYYERVNNIIDYSNANKDSLVTKGSEEQLDKLIAELLDRTVNRIKKIKTIDSAEWNYIDNSIIEIKNEIEAVVNINQNILTYYNSYDFLKIKDTCEVLMIKQREFNEYITEKVNSISKFFGTRVVRSETINNDEYNYIRSYKKTITPFTAEVSATVFSSAENSPLEYVVKNFYPNKNLYSEQIQKLYKLVEELETLRDAKQIIENYKAEYQQYIVSVPDLVMKSDEAGFYSRLGFANIDENALSVEYKFSYTSIGSKAQRSFTVPMTEETIIELIRLLENKLTASAFVKEQRILMTKKLREFIKNRDNFTCCNCGNSTHTEPNLLLEIDHIIPVSKGGCTVEENLQTLCWKCNRAKSDRIIN